MIKLSNGKKDISIFQWKMNPETGEYEAVPLNISPEDFWERWVRYEDHPFEQWRKWEEEYTFYNEDVLDAIDMMVDEMDSYPDARMIINYVRNNLGANDED